MKKTDATAKKRETFLLKLREGLSISAACRFANISRATVYRWRESDEDFLLAWEDAEEEGTDLLEDEAKRRAEQGVTKLVMHEGKPIVIGFNKQGQHCLPEADECVRTELLRESKYSDTLMIFLLKARRPKKYSEKHQLEGPGPDGALIVNVNKAMSD